MSRPKLHLIKTISSLIRARLANHRSVLIMGPLPVRKEILLKTMAELKPSAVLFIDGGLIHKKKFSVYKQLLLISLGDGDSASARPDYLFPAEKDVSDLAIALSCLKKTQVSKVTLLGFSGSQEELRPDHFLFNLGEVMRFVEAVRFTVQMDQFRFFPHGKHQFYCQTLFSVFSLRKTKIRLNGKAKYIVKEWMTLLPLSSHGLSNEGKGKIHLENKHAVAVYMAGEKIN